MEYGERAGQIGAGADALSASERLLFSQNVTRRGVVLTYLLSLVIGSQ